MIVKQNKWERLRYGILVVTPLHIISIAAAFVGICTLGYWTPSWEFKWMWFVIKHKGFERGGK